MTHNQREEELRRELEAFAQRIQQVRQSPEVKSVVDLEVRPEAQQAHGDAHHGH